MKPYALKENMFEHRDPVTAYLQEISGSKKLSSGEERILAGRIRTGDRAAMNLLVQANLRFVVAVCRNYESQGLPMPDLISEGNLGLIRAAEKFDANQNCRFISYAVWWIRQSIIIALAAQTRDVALSTSTTFDIHRIGIANAALWKKLGRPPSAEELELETGYKSDRIQTCLRLMRPSLSLDFPNQDEDGTLQDSFPDERESRTETRVERFQIRRALDQILSGLDRRERQVIESSFGLNAGETAASLQTLAVKLGVSKERVRQLKVGALRKLRSLLSLTAKYPCSHPHQAC